MSTDDITHRYWQLAEACWTVRPSLNLTYNPQMWYVLFLSKRQISLGVIVKRCILCAPHIIWLAAKLTLASWREGEPRHQFLSEFRLTWTSQRHFLLLSIFSASLVYLLPFSSNDKLCYPRWTATTARITRRSRLTWAPVYSSQQKSWDDASLQPFPVWRLGTSAQDTHVDGERTCFTATPWRDDVHLWRICSYIE